MQEICKHTFGGHINESTASSDCSLSRSRRFCLGGSLASAEREADTLIMSLETGNMCAIVVKISITLAAKELKLC